MRAGKTHPTGHEAGPTSRSPDCHSRCFPITRSSRGTEARKAPLVGTDLCLFYLGVQIRKASWLATFLSSSPLLGTTVLSYSHASPWNPGLLHYRAVGSCQHSVGRHHHIRSWARRNPCPAPSAKPQRGSAGFSAEAYLKSSVTGRSPHPRLCDLGEPSASKPQSPPSVQQH